MTMATTEQILSETMTSPETGETLIRGVRPFAVTYKGESVIVDLPGYYPTGEGDGLHVGKDMSIVDEALRDLKEKMEGVPSPATIRRVRAKLRLSQREAGTLFKVGENAFDKYERGLVEPSGPTIQLITLLDRHPDLVDELREGRGNGSAPLSGRASG
jgi:HTH-type transcriptional regulator / antitoxin MqsA